jgi:hypothetical protein
MPALAGSPTSTDVAEAGRAALDSNFISLGVKVNKAERSPCASATKDTVASPANPDNITYRLNERIAALLWNNHVRAQLENKRFSLED